MPRSADVACLIVVVRGQRVLLDSDLASLYGVTVKALKQAVRRNRERFPPDFLPELTTEDVQLLRSQTVTLELPASGSVDRRGRHAKYLPYAFTEQGVAMLASVLRSDRAIQANIAILRAFVQMRRLLATHQDLARKVDELERTIGRHDTRIREVFVILRRLLTEPPPAPSRPSIGFRPREGSPHR